MNQRIVYQNDEGGISIIVPAEECGLTIEEIAAKDVPAGSAYRRGTAGAIPETINDSGGTPHFVTSLYVNNTRVAIVSKDANFTPAAPTVTTFPVIYTGITLTNTGSPVFAGSATNAQLLDNLDSTDFMRATANTATTGTVRVQNNTGLFVGAANVFNVNTTSTDANVKSDISNGNLVIQANVGGTTFNVARALGSNGTFAIANAATVGTTLGVTGNITGGNLVTGAQVTATGNITGGNIITAALVQGATVSATANVVAGNVSTAGRITAAGNIISAANVTGSYLFGNGSQLTGLSLGVSVTQFQNGTTAGQAGTSGGNINFNVGGVANVVVIDTSTVYANVVNLNNITTPGNAVGNIGSASNPFNRVFAQSTTAAYADVAERFASDAVYSAGTVVELGGEMEITRARDELSELFDNVDFDLSLVNGNELLLLFRHRLDRGWLWFTTKHLGKFFPKPISLFGISSNLVNSCLDFHKGFFGLLEKLASFFNCCHASIGSE